ncbi:MAG: hypothetical protein AAB591_00355 [Patescibacteria group bacterium]
MFDQLKPIMQNGERYIVVEGGQPEYVLLRFEDYVTLVGVKGSNPGHGNPAGLAPDFARANAELEAVRHRDSEFPGEFGTREVLASAADPTTIRLEDLPL